PPSPASTAPASAEAPIAADTASSDPNSAVASAADLPLPPNFPGALAQIIKLTRAGVGENVVLAYVQNSDVHYAPTADETIYSPRCGLPQSVPAAIVNHQPRPTLSKIASAPPPPPPPPSAKPKSTPIKPNSSPPEDRLSSDLASLPFD